MKSSQSKVVSLSRLLELRAAWAFEGKSVVFTNGVFDILHAGHVWLLERARALGDVLVVGLNGDGSARKLGKGPARPVNSRADRAAVLAALGCVDAVVGFEEETPAALLEKIRPDILVKGADYRLSDVAGADFARRVVLLPLKKGRSTTGLIKRLQGVR